MILQSVLTCPHCGHVATETMPTDACQWFYECKGCGALLKPRAGGVAYVLAAMGDALSGVLDVTIAYPEHPPDAMLWRLLQGKIPRVVVRARLLPLPADTVGRDYVEDPDFSARMRAWVDRLWQEKDRLLDRLQGPAGS